MTEATRKFPPWLTKRLPRGEELEDVRDTLRDLHLATVCQEARCPNRCECFARGTATFMILGRSCTRNCRFCAVCSGEPEEVDPEEPERVALATEKLGLRHVVVTSVTRDDLPDGGSDQFAKTIRAVHNRTDATVEVLTPDFNGCHEDIDRVVEAGPDVFNHNIETVPRLYPEVRPEADYRQSLHVLERVSQQGRITKSGLMLGLGEREDEVLDSMRDLRNAGCEALTLGQYLSPGDAHHEVVEFVSPDRFERYKEKGSAMGFAGVASGPFVRSSYNAGEMAEELIRRQSM